MSPYLEHLFSLAATSPAEFAAYRSKLIESAICDMHEPEEMRQFQFQIDEIVWQGGPGLRACKTLLAQARENMGLLDGYRQLLLSALSRE